jgi:hypothetical protein
LIRFMPIALVALASGDQRRLLYEGVQGLGLGVLLADPSPPDLVLIITAWQKLHSSNPTPSRVTARAESPGATKRKPAAEVIRLTSSSGKAR